MGETKYFFENNTLISSCGDEKLMKDERVVKFVELVLKIKEIKDDDLYSWEDQVVKMTSITEEIMKIFCDNEKFSEVLFRALPSFVTYDNCHRICEGFYVLTSSSHMSWLVKKEGGIIPSFDEKGARMMADSIQGEYESMS